MRLILSTWKPLLIVAVATLILGAAVTLGTVWWFSPAWAAPALPSQHVGGIFADVNGDGRADFIVSAEVVFQAAPLPETAAQP